MLRNILSQIWLSLYKMSAYAMQDRRVGNKSNDKVKLMMVYVHEHYADKISVSEMAECCFLSERDSYRIFQECLHMTPTEYITNYRLQKACRMLIESNESVTAVSSACGMGSGSYFGKIFRQQIGMTPLSYRQKWQNSDR